MNFAMVADVHALSMGSVPMGYASAKRRMLRELAACGLAGQGFALFEQSRVPEILALSQLLAPFAPVGELRRMTQFETKAKEAEAAPLALLGYPCLMAADILGLGAMRAVVGEDQRQHLELARGVSARLRDALGVDLGQPRGFEPSSAVRVKSLRNPMAKMSKSDLDENGTIYLSDSFEQIQRKIRRAVTDSLPLPAAGEPLDAKARPGVANLLAILTGCSGRTIDQELMDLAGRGNSALKERVALAVEEVVGPISEAIEGGTDESARKLSEAGSERAREAAKPRLDAVLGALG
jgi:tryptophanyl-tRNA synthetase